MSFSRRTLSIFTLLLIAGAIAGGTWWRLRPEAEAAPQQGEASATVDSLGVDLGAAGDQFSTSLPQPVTGASVVRDTLWETVTAAGQAAAIRRATVASQVEGVIQMVPVRENARVGGSALILQIDTVELALEVARARAELANAQAQYEATTLFDDEITDPRIRARREQVARASSGLNAAEVGLRQAELRLERTSVRAPFQGRIADLRVFEGQYVAAGTELMTVVDLDPIKVEVSVLEAELGYLDEGRQARVTFAAFPDEVFLGRIETINPIVSEERTGRVTVHLSNPDGRVKPGMYADVTIDARSFPERILVPRSAILERDRRTMLFVYDGDDEQGLAKWRYVTTGRENETLVEIVVSDETDMVDPGEVVLVDGHHYLAHDTRVRLVDNPATAGGRPGA
ncbi:MAG: efflux RND transporter periplasmic adaptor subunit [Gemmatimonadetes bacterium]|nr:efflux RND transporter periplasmic adaptor subunit [Gemmatimonadota bacterium]